MIQSVSSTSPHLQCYHSFLSLFFCLDVLLTIRECGLLLLWWTFPLSVLWKLTLHISVFLCWVCVVMTVIVIWLFNHDKMPSLLTILTWVYWGWWGQGHPCSPLVLILTDALFHLYPPAEGASSNLKQASCIQGVVRLLGYCGLTCVCLTEVPTQPFCLLIDGGFYSIYM